MHKTLIPHWKSLLAFVGLIFVIQLIGNLTTIPEISGWYATQNHPFWTPPNWVFGPVWTILYVMIAVSGWLLWNKIAGAPKQKLQSPALRFYFIQLFLNFIWSPLFFKWHLLEVALIDISLLVIFVTLMIKKSMSVDRKAAYLLVPYLLWIIYAMTLNAGFVYLN